MDRKINKNQIAAVHNGRYSTQKSHHNRKIESPSLFSWLNFEKGSIGGSCERPNSQLSNLSGLSDSEDDYFRQLRDNLDSGHFSLDKIGNGAHYHKVIVDLNNELLNAKTENIQMKFKLDEAKTSLEMEWTEKVRRLSNENRNILEEKISLEKTVNELRKSLKSGDFDELKSKIDLLESERVKDEMELFQSRNFIQDLQIKLETKEKASSNLKDQIVELHAKNQELMLQVRRVEGEVATVRNEMEMLKKSETWFKNELHEAQNKKLKFQEDLMSMRNELQMERNKNGRLYTEFTQLLRNCEDIEAKAVREKESMMRKLENIQMNLGASMDKNHLLTHVKDASDRQETLKVIEGLYEEISQVSHKAEQQETVIRQLEQTNKALMSSEATLQMKLSDSLISVSVYENKVKELEENLKLTQSQSESMSYQNLDLRAENERLSLHFEAMSVEKGKIDKTVQKLREDFEIIMTRFKKLTEELSEKDKKISELVLVNSDLRAGLRENESLLLNDMTTENQLLKNDVINCETRVKSLNEELDHLRRLNKQREAEISDLRTKIDIKMQEIELLNESNHVGRLEISQLTTQLQNLFGEIKSKNERITGLLRTNRELEDRCKSSASFEAEMNTKVALFSTENQSLTQQIACLMQQIDESVPVDAKRMDKSSEVDSITSEIETLRADMEIQRLDFEDKLVRSENNSKTLIKKLKEQICQTKIAEGIAKERNEMALSNAEIEAQLRLSESKIEVLESKCKNFHEELDKTTKELKNAANIFKDNGFWRDDDLIISTLHLVDLLNIEKRNSHTLKTKYQNLAAKLEKASMEKAPEQVRDSRVFELENRILELESTAKTKETQIDSLEKELQSVQEQTQAYTAQNEALKLKLVTISSQNSELSDKILDLKNQLHSSGFEIQMLEEKAESYRQMERNLVQSKEQLLRDMQGLRKELSIEHEEKMELQRLATELKFALGQVMESSKEEKSYPSLRRTDFSKTLQILEKSASVKTASLTPLQECVDSLKQEMDVLNKMIRQNSQIRTEITNEMSLMDELKLVAER